MKWYERNEQVEKIIDMFYKNNKLAVTILAQLNREAFGKNGDAVLYLKHICKNDHLSISWLSSEYDITRMIVCFYPKASPSQMFFDTVNRRYIPYERILTFGRSADISVRIEISNSFSLKEIFELIKLFFGAKLIVNTVIPVSSDCVSGVAHTSTTVVTKKRWKKN